MKVGKVNPNAKNVRVIGDEVYHQIGVDNKGHIYFAAFKKPTDKLTGFHVDNGRQLKPIDVNAINYESFQKQKGKVQQVSRRK